MDICVISNGYPSPGRPEYPFVEQLCNEFARKGNNVTVIAPQSVTKRLFRHLPAIRNKRVFLFGAGDVTVYAPQYISLSNLGNKIPFLKEGFRNAVIRVLNNLETKPDIIYGHFWHTAFAAYPFAKKYNIPLFVATGEAEIEQTVKNEEEREFRDYIKGVICVSTKNMNESIKKNLLNDAPTIVVPNAIDNQLFHVMDKQLCRKKLGINEDDFVVAFVGGFIHRKGPDRVSNAIDNLNDMRVKSIFIGANKDGKSIQPTCKGIVHCGPVRHEDIPMYLNAADVFVLPTLFEGCCNAIVEAMACGLPIVSSDLEFNYDILDKSNSILVDPNNVIEISDAIKSIKDDSRRRQSMIDASLEKARNLTISHRASRIIDFINRNINRMSK